MVLQDGVVGCMRASYLACIIAGRFITPRRRFRIIARTYHSSREWRQPSVWWTSSTPTPLILKGEMVFFPQNIAILKILHYIYRRRPMGRVFPSKHNTSPFRGCLLDEESPCWVRGGAFGESHFSVFFKLEVIESWFEARTGA